MALIHADPAIGGLGLPKLWDTICRRAIGSHIRTLDTEDRYAGDKQVEALVGELKEPQHNLYNVKSEIYSKVDGRAMDHHVRSTKYKSKWVRNVPKWVPDYFYRACIRVRLGVVMTPARSARMSASRKTADGSIRTIYCPFCKDEKGKLTRKANLDHINSSCKKTKGLRTLRHDKILDMMSAQFERMKGTGSQRVLTKVVREAKVKQNDGGTVAHKPDFIVQQESREKVQITVIDPSVISCFGDLKKSHQTKAMKYNVPLVHSYLRKHFTVPHEVTYTAAIIDWRGQQSSQQKQET